MRKRKYIRIEMLQHATVEFQGMDYTSCSVNNLSLTGMFLCGSFYQKAGDECIVRYTRIYNNSAFSFHLKARVVRKTREGIGLEFLSMAADNYMQLQTSLLYEAVDPLAIGLELPDDCPFDITGELSGDARKSMYADIACH